MLIWKLIHDDDVITIFYIPKALGRNVLTVNSVCICLIIFKGTEEMCVINLPSKYQLVALGRCKSR